MVDIAQGKTGVRTLHPDYKKYMKKWARCRDAMEGQDAIHDAGEAYLPRLKEQTNEDYVSYKKRANWYNASWRTVAGLNGMMFRKPPKQDIPAKILPYLKNVNLCGDDFNQFSQEIAVDVLEVGRIGLLVDHPEMPSMPNGATVTVAQAETMGLRPTIQSYETECIINWQYRTIANATVLSMVVLAEEYSEDDPKSEFNQIVENRYRVIDLDDNNLYRVRVFRINKNDQDELVGAAIYPMMNGKPMSYIPFVFIGPDGTNEECESPPLIDLVDLNISHYRTTADYEHGIHFSALPTFWVAGYNAVTDANGVKEKIYLGSQSAIILPDPQAKAGFAEVTHDFKSHRDNLDAKKQEMATLGARMLADTSVRQVETFGATAIKHVAENSILASIAISISKGLTQALEWFCEWSSVDGSKIIYDINRDFLPVQMDAPTLTALIQALQGGLLSEPEVFDILKRGDMVEADKTLEQHQAEIDANPPPAPPSNAQPGRLGTPTHEEQMQQQAQRNQMNGNQPPSNK